MNTTVRQLILLILISAGVLLPSFSFSDECTNIDEATFNEKRRPFVCFIHDEHNEKAGLEEDCALCHHTYEEGKLVEDESSEDMACSECHAKENDPKQFELTATYHKRCRGCHLEKKEGPITCGACHKKAK